MSTALRALLRSASLVITLPFYRSPFQNSAETALQPQPGAVIVRGDEKVRPFLHANKYQSHLHA